MDADVQRFLWTGLEDVKSACYTPYGCPLDEGHEAVLTSAN